MLKQQKKTFKQMKKILAALFLRGAFLSFTFLFDLARVLTLIILTSPHLFPKLEKTGLNETM